MSLFPVEETCPAAVATAADATIAAAAAPPPFAVSLATPSNTGLSIEKADLDGGDFARLILVRRFMRLMVALLDPFVAAPDADGVDGCCALAESLRSGVPFALDFRLKNDSTCWLSGFVQTESLFDDVAAELRGGNSGGGGSV